MSSNLISKEKYEDKIVKLQLGDIIQIINDKNERLNNQIFIIDYIDRNKIILINTDTLDKLKLSISDDGLIGDGTIQELIILSRSNQEGYAKQNDLTPGKFIDIHFGGDYPTIISGDITNLENDMIEIKTIDNDVLYINFDYKGIPDDLPIDFIEIREKPSILNKEKKIEFKSEEEIDELEDLDKVQTYEDKVDEDIEIKVPIRNIKNQLREFIIKADQIQFGDEDLGKVIEFKDVDSRKERFSIDTQVNDLLEDLLSSIPDSQRTNKVLNNLHVMIERFKQLRTKFSKFDEYGNVEKKLTFEANYKPLLEYFESFNKNLYWILPVVKNVKKLYNVELNEDGEANDYISLNLNDNLIKMKEDLEEYKSSLISNEQNRYKNLYQDLNEFFTPFEKINDESNDLIIQKEVGTNITTIINNLEEIYSSVFGNNNVKSRRFLIQKYNLGLSKLITTEQSNNKMITTRIPISNPDLLQIQSFLTLPEPVIRFSKINLPGTYLIDQVSLNNIFINYWEFLKNKTKVQKVFVDNLNDNILFNEENFVNNIKNFILNLNVDQKRGLSDDEIYKKFVNIIIPKTKIIFNLMKKYIKGKLSVVDIVSYLEPFLIYTDNLTYMQFLDITNFINEEISQFNKNFIEKSRIFYKLKNITSDKLVNNTVFSIVFNLKEELREDVYSKYQIDLTDLLYSNSEYLKKTINIDSNQLYCSALSIQTLPLMIPSEFNDIYRKEDKELDLKINESTNELCKNLPIAKKYNSKEELLSDNEIDIYFDKKFDKTDYSILDNYQSQLVNMNDDSFVVFLTDELKKKYKLSELEASRLAETLLIGHKKVVSGDYAILIEEENSDNEVTYYIRKDNKWILENESELSISNMDSSLNCNLKEKCIEKENECESIEKDKFTLKKELIKDINDEFDSKYYQSSANLKNIINQNFEYRNEITRILIELEWYNKLFINNQRYSLGANIEESEGEKTVSPKARILNLILSQGDFIKKQYDIIKFVDKFTRPAIEKGIGPLNEIESKWWFYCRESNLPILPVFKFNLASSFVTERDNYVHYLEKVISEIGKLSDDGDYWVDEHSGWTIKKIDDDYDEGYTDGFKQSSRSILDEDIGNNINLSKNIVYITPETKLIINLINSLSIAMGINLENQKEFIINTVLDSIKETLESEADYKVKIKEFAARNKKLMSYIDLYNSALLYYTLGVFLIAIQTSIPSIKTRKTHPGCIKSFSGFPFEGTGDFSSLHYLSCIVVDIKHSGEPWYVLKGKKEEFIFNKIKNTIENVLLNQSFVKRKIIEKTEFLLINPDENLPSEYDVSKWSQFLPPLVSFHIKNLTNITSDFKNKLKNELKAGSNCQRLKILLIYGKIISFSLAIQEEISKVIKNKDLLMVNQNNEPFLENACCESNDKMSTIQYFKTKSNEIENYTKIVENLSLYLKQINLYSKASLLYTTVNTKNIYPSITNKFDEKIIYLSFIHFCKFKTAIPIPEYLLPLCTDKPGQDLFQKDISTDDLIFQLKKEGREFNYDTFLRLIQLISRHNIINIDFSSPLISKLTKLSGFLEHLQNETKEPIEPKLPIELLSKVIDTFEIGNKSVTTESTSLNNYLIKSNESLKEDIKVFLLENKSNKVTKSSINKTINCITNLMNWSSQKEDKNDIYNQIEFYKNYIKYFINVFPNIILNEVNYKNIHIPNYLGLSYTHSKKIQEQVVDYYKKLHPFYGAKTLEKIITNIQRLGKNLCILSNLTPSFSTLYLNDETVYPIFNERTSILLYEFYILKSISYYIYLSNDKNSIVREYDEIETDTVLYTEEYIDDVNAKVDFMEIQNRNDKRLLSGDKKELKEQTSQLIINYLNILCDHKNKIDLSYEDIQNQIFRQKEKEKDLITDRLQALTDEERNADTILKINKLGIWSKGLQKGLTKYVKETYDDERELRNELEMVENKIRKNNDISDDNINLFIDDYFENEDVERMIDHEVNDLSNLDEDYNYVDHHDEYDEYED
jgi:hypothetical protein